MWHTSGHQYQIAFVGQLPGVGVILWHASGHQSHIAFVGQLPGGELYRGAPDH